MIRLGNREARGPKGSSSDLASNSDCPCLGFWEELRTTIINNTELGYSLSPRCCRDVWVHYPLLSSLLYPAPSFPDPSLQLFLCPSSGFPSPMLILISPPSSQIPCSSRPSQLPRPLVPLLPAAHGFAGAPGGPGIRDWATAPSLLPASSQDSRMRPAVSPPTPSPAAKRQLLPRFFLQPLTSRGGLMVICWPLVLCFSRLNSIVCLNFPKAPPPTQEVPFPAPLGNP